VVYYAPKADNSLWQLVYIVLTNEKQFTYLLGTEDQKEKKMVTNERRRKNDTRKQILPKQRKIFSHVGY